MTTKADVRRRGAALIHSLLFGATVLGGSLAPASAVARTWTLEDIATAPEVLDFVLSADRRYAALLTRKPDLNRPEDFVEVRIFDVPRAVEISRKEVSSASLLRRLPRSNDWTLLADVGLGQQLYRLNSAGGLSPIIISPADSVMGKAPGALGTTPVGKPIKVGILNYGYASDGKSLWYVRAKQANAVSPQIFTQPEINFYPFGAGAKELVIRAHEKDFLVAQMPSQDQAAFVPAFSGETVRWISDQDGIQFQLTVRNADNNLVSERHALVWDGSNYARSVSNAAYRFQTPDGGGVKGPHGGTLTIEGFADARRLTEKTGHTETIWLEPADLSFSTSTASGSFELPGGGLALPARRDNTNHRETLLLLSDGRTQDLDHKRDLTGCQPDQSGEIALCISQTLTQPPRLSYYSLRSRKLIREIALEPKYEDLTRFKFEPRIWGTSPEKTISGFIAYPTGYRRGQRYPAMFVIHGWDGYNQFANLAYQWNFPIQYWLERGYVVVVANEPSLAGSRSFTDAMNAWSAAARKMPPEQLQDSVFLNAIEGLDGAADSLIREGLIDPARIGIAGYSRGEQMSSLAITHSRNFRAASSGDGGLTQPGVYWIRPQTSQRYRNTFGGSPYDPANYDLHRRMSPVFRADLANGALLQQVVTLDQTKAELMGSFLDHGKPAEISFYPDESHVFHNPANRLTALSENFDWFEFWLSENSATISPDRAKRWGALKAKLDAKR